MQVTSLGRVRACAVGLNAKLGCEREKVLNNQLMVQITQPRADYVSVLSQSTLVLIIVLQTMRPTGSRIRTRAGSEVQCLGLLQVQRQRHHHCNVVRPCSLYQLNLVLLQVLVPTWL